MPSWQNRSVLFSFVQFCVVSLRRSWNFDWSALFIDARHKSALVPKELLSVAISIVTLTQLLLDALEFFSQVSEVLFVGGEDPFLDGFHLDGARFFDFTVNSRDQVWAVPAEILSWSAIL
jgi:hypothetical protein